MVSPWAGKVKVVSPFSGICWVEGAPDKTTQLNPPRLSRPSQVPQPSGAHVYSCMQSLAAGRERRHGQGGTQRGGATVHTPPIGRVSRLFNPPIMF